MEEDDVQFANLSPAVREDVREVLAGTASVAVAAQLASEPSAPDEALDVLSTFPDPQVRALVARHPNLAGNTREKMVTHRIEGDEWARATLASRPDLSDEELATLLSDPSPRVRQFAIRNQGVSDDQIRAVLNNADEDEAVVQEAQKVAKERGIGHIDPQEVLDMTAKIKIVSDRMVAVAKAVEEGWMSPEWAVAEHALLSVEMAELTKQSIQLGASAATRDPQVAEDAHKKIQEAGVNALESELTAAQEALNSGDSNTAELFDNVERRVQQLKDLNVALPSDLQARVDDALSQSREQVTLASQVAVDEPATVEPQVAVSEPEVSPTTATPVSGPTPSTSWSPQAQTALNTMLNVVPARAKKLLDEAQKENLTTAQWAALNDEWDGLLNDWRGARSTLNRSGVVPTTATGDAVAAARDSYDSASREFSALYDAFLDRETAKARAARDAARSPQTSPAQAPPDVEPSAQETPTPVQPPAPVLPPDAEAALRAMEDIVKTMESLAASTRTTETSDPSLWDETLWSEVDERVGELDRLWGTALVVLPGDDDDAKMDYFPTYAELKERLREARREYGGNRNQAAVRRGSPSVQDLEEDTPTVAQATTPSAPGTVEGDALVELADVATRTQTLATQATTAANAAAPLPKEGWSAADQNLAALDQRWEAAFDVLAAADEDTKKQNFPTLSEVAKKRSEAKAVYAAQKNKAEQAREVPLPVLSDAAHNPFAPAAEPDAPAAEQPTPAQEVPEEKSEKTKAPDDASSLFVAQQLLRSKKLSDKAPLYKALLGFEESEKAIPLADCLHNMVSSEAAAEYLFDVMSPAQRAEVGRKVAQVNNPVLNKEWRKALLRAKRLTREEKRQLNKGNVKGAAALTAGLAIIATAGSIPTVGPLVVGGVMVAGLVKVSVPILHIVNEGVQSGQGAGHIAAELIKWAGTSGYQLAKGAMYATTTANRKLNEGVAVAAVKVTPTPVKRSIKLGANKSAKAVSKSVLKGTQALGFNLDEKPEQLEAAPTKPKEPAHTR